MVTHCPKPASQRQCRWGSTGDTAGLVQKGLRSTERSLFPSGSTWISGLHPGAVVSQGDGAWGTMRAPLFVAPQAMKTETLRSMKWNLEETKIQSRAFCLQKIR